MSYSWTHRFHFKRSGDSSVYESERQVTEDGTKSVDCDVWGANPDYRFYLTRDALDRAWVVRELRRSMADAASNEGDYARQFDLAALLMFDEPLPAIFASRYTTIESADEVVVDGKKLARVTFRYHVPKGARDPALDPAFGRVVQGTLLLNPAEYWRTVDAQLSLTRNRTMHWTYSINPAFPRMLSVYEYRGLTPDQDASERCEYQRVSYDCSFSAAEFRLPAYGLPEPPGMEASRSFGLAWVLGFAGIAAIVVGIWLMRLRRMKTG
jgi:hypothetical protein